MYKNILGHYEFYNLYFSGFLTKINKNYFLVTFTFLPFGFASWMYISDFLR